MRSKCADMPLKSFMKMMTLGSGKDFFELNSIIGSGNNKLPTTTAIFNMGPAHGCPSFELGLCKAYTPEGRHCCYAKKFENDYFSNVLSRRQKQAEFWKRVKAEEFFLQFVAINSLREVPWTKMRLNESGDFYGQECVDKAEKIAMMLARVGVRCYCYTHRSDLDYRNAKHLIVSGSNFMKEGIENTFQIVENPDTDTPKGWSVCLGDCTICDKCSIRGYKIVVKRH